MERLNQDKNEVVREISKKKDAEHDISKKRYFIAEFIFKPIYLCIGIRIAYLLYNECLFDNTCNPIVVTFFSILSLACFLALGLPIDKLVNIHLK
ncbi:MAG: hypothetical protein ABSE81_02880 [Candidatus Omnitrophota bacterium]|jgi:hypothetical protein